jgi:hypothetical protein
MSLPKFGDFGKKAKDLFKKNYDYDSTLKLTDNAKPIDVETKVALPLGKAGSSKLTYKEDAFDVEATVCSKGNCGLTFTLKSLMPGLTLKTDVAKQSITKTYKMEGFTYEGSADLAQNLDASATVAVNPNLNVGASASLSLAKDDTLQDYNVGAEYTNKNVVLSFFPTSKLNGSCVSWHQKTEAGTFGLKVNSPAGGDSSLLVGGETKISDDTTFRGKLCNQGIVGTSITHIFSQPSVKATLATEFDIFADDIAPKKIGFNLHFGHF